MQNSTIILVSAEGFLVQFLTFSMLGSPVGIAVLLGSPNIRNDTHCIQIFCSDKDMKRKETEEVEH